MTIPTPMTNAIIEQAPDLGFARGQLVALGTGFVPAAIARGATACAGRVDRVEGRRVHVRWADGDTGDYDSSVLRTVRVASNTHDRAIRARIN